MDQQYNQSYYCLQTEKENLQEQFDKAQQEIIEQKKLLQKQYQKIEILSQQVELKDNLIQKFKSNKCQCYDTFVYDENNIKLQELINNFEQEIKYYQNMILQNRIEFQQRLKQLELQYQDQNKQITKNMNQKSKDQAQNLSQQLQNDQTVYLKRIQEKLNFMIDSDY